MTLDSAALVLFGLLAYVAAVAAWSALVRGSGEGPPEPDGPLDEGGSLTLGGSRLKNPPHR